MLGMIIDIMKFLLLVYIALELRDISAKLSNKFCLSSRNKHSSCGDVLPIQPKQTRFLQLLWQSCFYYSILSI